ncbi:MAG: NAD-dependent epimerase/dehydratase family protein [Clostridiales bacterium]|jgi:nucleoside-diphosphate-sugar epimerase|nr:NAD-dependent epimerase/dehydratase family protein [Clostridiales bacterium]
MWKEERLESLLNTPTDALIRDAAKIEGDILVLGAGGKMGPTVCMTAKKAIDEAGITKRVIAVSRFSDSKTKERLLGCGIELIEADLLDTKALYALPDVKNVIYMAGRKFGTNGEEWKTWSMNAALPAFVADKYRNSNILVFSSGNIYPPVAAACGGCSENNPAAPRGEYAMSCLARERAFEYAARAFGTKILLYRLNYAVDLRYGVLCDIAENLAAGKPINLNTACFNVIWQGTAAEIAIRGLLYCESPAFTLNVTGPETISVEHAARRMAEILGVEPLFEGEPQPEAYLSNSGLMVSLFGYPAVSAETMLTWQAEWFRDGGRRLGKPTHFEERGGVY